MSISINSRKEQQSGQMLVSVIVLLVVMFFIGSAMALAVSSSLHTIAQINSTDSVAYAAEAATGQGSAIAQAARKAYAQPSVEHLPADNNGNRSRSYSYEVLDGAGSTLGRSTVGTDTRGVDNLDATNYETITITEIPGAANFELYRTQASGSPSTVGFIGTFPAAGDGDTVVKDSGLAISDAPPLDCQGSKGAATPLNKGKVNGQALFAGTCYAALNASNPVKTWSILAGQVATCASNLAAVPDRAPGEFGVAWGVIGWHSASGSLKQDLKVSIGNGCSGGTPCDLPLSTTLPSTTGVLFFRCNLNATSRGSLNLFNPAANPAVNVSAFVIRDADTGGDCMATTVGLAATVVDESDWRLSTCAWTDPANGLTLWNRVLP